MSLTFPLNPTPGQTYLAENGQSYTWIGNCWQATVLFNDSLTHLIPSSDQVYDLGAPDKQWRHLYVSTGTIYVGGVPITVNSATNTLVVGTSSYAASTTTSLATESFVIDYVNQTGGGGGFSGNYNDLTNKPTIPADIGDLTDTGGLLALEGLPTVTIPETTGTTYKGLQVSYGLVHSNGSSSELNVSKIVIHKPAITVTTIDPTSNNDNFKVDGLGSSDVLALFVLYGDTNGPKALSTLTSFVQTIIDNVILDAGVEGNFNSLSVMQSNFYSNYSSIAAAAGGLDLDFQFFNNFTPTTTGTTTVLEGSGAVFDIADNGDGTYGFSAVVSSGTNYLTGHKI